MHQVNVNVGILGHVDSGKTSLVRSLSTHLSTAALDKNPQSKARGITLDLGFSSFSLPFENDDAKTAQITLVDCPGHASLIKTVIGGAHIIDMALLVIDAVKGIQMQTIESTVLAEIATPHVLVVLNKIDLFKQETREEKIHKMTATIREFLSTSPSLKDVPIIPVASGDAEGTRTTQGMDRLLAAIQQNLFVPNRSPDGPLCYAIDHCFPLRGKGTVLTGTVLTGCVRVNDTISLPMIGVEKKVKSLQMFHTNVDQAIQGDRVGIRLHGLDADAMERGLAITPKSLSFSQNLIVPVHQIRFFSLICESGSKLHVTVGHSTVLAKATFFYDPHEAKATPFNIRHEYSYLAALESLHEMARENVFVLLQLERGILCPPQSQVVCSRLDTDVNKQLCRIAFFGALETSIADVSSLLIGKVKERHGAIDKLFENGVVVVKDLFGRETNLEIFRGLRIQNTRTNEVGVLDAAFGKTGKCRANFETNQSQPGDRLIMRFTKVLFQDKTRSHRLRQTPAIYDKNTTTPDSLKRHGPITTEEKILDVSDAILRNVEKVKQCRVGLVERLKGETAPNGSNPMIIATGLFATADEATLFLGYDVVTDAKEVGKIEALFGKAGKVRILFELGTQAKVGDTIKLFEK